MLSVELFRCKHTAIAGDWLGQGQSDRQDGFYGIIIAGDGAHEKEKKYAQDLSTQGREGALCSCLFPSFASALGRRTYEATHG